MENEDLDKITNVVDGIIDFRRNASDNSRVMFSRLLKHKNYLCLGFSMLLYNPDDTIPEKERWAFDLVMPMESKLPSGLHSLATATMRHLMEGLKAFWNDDIKFKDKNKMQ